jgi:citrate synthase
MLEEIGTVDRIPEYVQGVKDKKYQADGLRPPRVQELRPARDRDAEDLPRSARPARHGNDPLLHVAMELEKVALSDPYFIDRKLYPNIDFYSGITLRAIGFPTNMFTVLFALARTVGWISQWKGNVRGSRPEDRSSASALHRRNGARLHVSVDKR